MSLKQLSSTCHVSSFDAPETAHQHKFSLTHFIPFSTFPMVSPLHTGPVTLDPYKSLRCSTVEWRINANPTSHRFSPCSRRESWGSFFWGPGHWYRAVGGHVHRDMTSTIWCIRTCATTESRMIKSRQNHNHHNHHKGSNRLHALVLCVFQANLRGRRMDGECQRRRSAAQGAPRPTSRVVEGPSEGERCTRRTKLHGNRRHLSRGRRRLSLRLPRRRGLAAWSTVGRPLPCRSWLAGGTETPLLHGCCTGGQKEGGGGECGE